MCRTVLLLFLSFVLSIQFASSQPVIDSLSKQLWSADQTYADRDTALMKDAYTLAVKYYRVNQDSSIKYFTYAMEVASLLKDTTTYVKCALNSAGLYKNQGIYSRAIQLLKLCIDLQTEQKILARCLKLKGDIHAQENEYDLSKPLLDSALATAILLKDTVLIGNTYNSLALYFERTQDYQLAMDNYLMSRNNDLLRGDSIGYAVSTCNIAFMLNDMKEYDKSYEYLVDAEKYIHPSNSYNMIQITNGMGAYYSRKQDYTNAKVQYERSLGYAQKLASYDHQAGAYYNLANDAYSQSKYKTAQEYIESGLAVPHLTDSRAAKINLLRSSIYLNLNECKTALQILEANKSELLKQPIHSYRSSTYKNIARCHACLGNYKAFDDNLLLAFSVLDSGYVETKSKEASIIEAKYRTRIKQDSINTLALQLENSGYKIKNQRYGILLILFSLLGTFLFANLLRKRYQKTKQDLDVAIFEKEEIAKLNAQLQKKLQDGNSIIPKSRDKLELKGLDKVHMVIPEEIIYIAAEDNGTRIYTHNSSVWSAVKFKEVYEQLDKSSFLQIFRSKVINIHKLEWVNHATLKMSNGDELKIGRTYKKDLKDIFS